MSVPNNAENEDPPPELPLVEILTEDDPNFNFLAEDIISIIEQCEKASEDYAMVNMNNKNSQLTMTSKVI